MHYLLHQALEVSAQRFPDKDAFVCGKVHFTFAEANAQANRLAHYLISQGVKRGDRVGVYMGRCIESAIAVYGIMKAGAAYVPIDPSAPAERTKFVINDCGIRVLITAPNWGKSLTGDLGVDCLIGFESSNLGSFISWEGLSESEAVANPDLRLLEDDLAYIMYTSGTTGTPKGIMHTHRSGLAYAKLSAELFNLNETDRIGNHASLFFDISTLGYFTAPLVGATTVLTTEAHTLFPGSLAQMLAAEKLTVWYSVPLALTQMLQSGQLEGADCSSLRWVLFGGEAFAPKTLRQLMELWPQATFSNIYGPAEVNQCSYYHVPAPPVNDEPIPLGHIWNNTEALIVDGDQPVATSEVGELCIRSATMMAGYWKQPELTDKSLLKVIGTDGLEKVYYRTGDLSRQDENGLYHFLGRKDRQIKVRGYRVELEEVTNALQRHPEVAEAVAFAMDETDGTKAIHSAVVPVDGAHVTETQLLDFVRLHLPRYAVPTNIELITDLPRTTAGKINIRELQQATSSRAGQAANTRD